MKLNTCRALLTALTLGALLPLTPALAQNDTPTPGIVETTVEERDTRFFVLEPHAAFFMPKAAQTRDIFGEAWQTAGLTINLVEKQLCPNHQISLRIDPLLREVGDNHLYLVPLGVEYTGYLRQQGRVRPYWIASLDALYIDLAVPGLDIDEDQLSLGLTAGFGAKIGQNGFVQLTYQTTEHVQDFDVCGVKLAAGIAF